MVSFEARPTEYKGTVYRSKCEAMFACWLEHYWSQRQDPFGIIYEPEYLRASDGWVPDFLVWSVGNIEIGCPQLTRVLYEYKPSKPTKTYLRTFIKRTKELENRCSDPFIPLLMYGSVYNSDRGNALGESGLRSWDWLGEFENIIKETRFDLEAQHG
jgi:hypothetical protein